MREELLKGLTEEQTAKAKACHNQEELLSLAKSEGIELSDEQLAVVSGGACTPISDFICPQCKSNDIESRYYQSDVKNWYHNTCRKCGYQWSVDAK